MTGTNANIANLNDAIEALERKVGVNGSSDPLSLDYKITHANTAVGNYRFDQSMPSAIWTVNHNLGFQPGGIYCEDSAGTMLGPSVVHVDNYNIILYFLGATDGFALFS